MKREEVSEAFRHIKASAESIGGRALAGAQLDELLPVCHELFDAIAEVLRRVNSRREIVDAQALRRAVYAFAHISALDFEHRHAAIRKAIDDIARLEHLLLDALDPQQRNYYAR